MSEKSPFKFERPSGTYYAYTADAGLRKDAAHGCARLGAILAPITTIAYYLLLNKNG